MASKKTSGRRAKGSLPNDVPPARQSAQFELPNGNWIATEWCPACREQHYFLLKRSGRNKRFSIWNLNEEDRSFVDEDRRVIYARTPEEACEIIRGELEDDE
jgi:hypothetical protein